MTNAIIASINREVSIHLKTSENIIKENEMSKCVLEIYKEFICPYSPLICTFIGSHFLFNMIISSISASEKPTFARS